MAIIKTVNLSKYYGKTRGIKNLNLTVNEGDFFGFIGPNGAGKSTTIRTLLGFIAPNEGKTLVFDKDITQDKEEILKDVGYLPSEAIFYEGMKVKDVIKLSADLRKIDCAREAEILCERLKLDISRKIDDLSFGNRKKVAIVCALEHNPKLIILDEPTSGLDPLMQKEFFDILHERSKAGATIFLSSHILSEIEHNCTRAAIIRDGKIIKEGSVEELSKTNAKRITIEGMVDVQKLKGIKDIKTIDHRMSFLYSGDMNDLLHILALGNIKDLSINEPDLEEIFMHYYEKDGDNK